MQDFPNIVVVGKRASGKSTFSDYVSGKYGYIILRFSETIKMIAKEKEWFKPETFDRRILQDWGLKLKKGNGMDFLAIKTVEKIQPGFKHIFDGARELEEVNVIKKRTNSYLVYIDADFDVRFQRVNKRDGWTLEEFQKTEEHPVDANIEKLKDIADYVIINNYLSIYDFYESIDFFFKNIKS